jgi:hypothetical protein
VDFPLAETHNLAVAVRSLNDTIVNQQYDTVTLNQLSPLDDRSGELSKLASFIANVAHRSKLLMTRDRYHEVNYNRRYYVQQVGSTYITYYTPVRAECNYIIGIECDFV